MMDQEKIKKKKYLPVKDAFRVLSYLFAAVMISACSNRYVFPTSEVLPAAEAVVKIEENKNNNYEIELEIENMARPERLSPPRSNYVVWMVSETDGTINVGNLRINRKNNASLTTVTPYKPVRIFITAEDSHRVRRPSSQVVLESPSFDLD